MRVAIQYNLSKNNYGGFAEILGENINCGYRYNISIGDGTRTGNTKEKYFGFLILLVQTSEELISRQFLYNNTVLFLYKSHKWECNEPNLLIRANTENIIIYNNLIYIDSGASMDIRTVNASSKTLFKNNVYYGTTSFGALGSSTTNNYDSSEFNNTWNPLLVNPGGTTANDYKLQSTSQAIGNGILINGSSDVTNYSQNNGGRDYFGNTVLDNANPIIGAFNYDNIAQQQILPTIQAALQRRRYSGYYSYI